MQDDPVTSFAVSVRTGELHFSAAHFITYENTCENLHGHNFHVRVDAIGGNTADGLVIDFVLLNRLAAQICQQLHDKILLPGESREMQVVHQGESVHVTSYGKSFTFPEENCLILPIANTTAEMLARHICDQLVDKLTACNGLDNVTELAVAVEEADNQWGSIRRRIRS